MLFIAGWQQTRQTEAAPTSGKWWGSVCRVGEAITQALALTYLTSAISHHFSASLIVHRRLFTCVVIVGFQTSTATIKTEFLLALFKPPLSLLNPQLPLPAAALQRASIMADKLRTLQQLESLQAKYVGTGHADTTRHEWTSNIVRDSYASYIGHPPLLAYMALGMGESKEIVRAQMIEAMIRGAGKPPAREDD